MIAAIIPARGGSKGIPRKNLTLVGGKPLIAWSILAAQKSSLVDGVYVTTDDKEIASVAKRFGATVIVRPAELATDDATSEAALIHALDAIDGPVSLVVFLQPTSPLRHDNDIDRAIRALQAADADSCFSARRIEGYIWLGENGHVLPTYRARQRRQELSTIKIEENGSIYVFKPPVLRCYGKRIGGKVAVYFQDPVCGYQIDEPRDVLLIERLLRTVA